MDKVVNNAVNRADTLADLIATRRENHSLPRAFYLDPEVFQADLEHVFRRSWLFAGHACEVANPGDYLLLDLAGESVILVRDRSGKLHAHLNVCRHRGSKIITHGAPCGHAKALVCPYHQWAYRLDGELAGARLMGEGFQKSAHSLRSVHVRDLAGLLFVCLADTPPDFSAAHAAIAPQLAPHRLDRTKVIRRHHYALKANWKTVIENNRECYHCSVTHPEFCLSNYDLGLPGDARQDAAFQRELNEAYERWERMGLSPQEVSFPDGSWFRVSRYPLKAGYLTESMDGGLTAPLLGDLTDVNVGSLRLIGLPNFWAHANADYVMTTRLTPVNAEVTHVDVAFLVREDAVEGDYDPEAVEKVWKATSEEDWELCENNFAGLRSAFYEPGPLSPLEASVEAFFGWYTAKLSRGTRFRLSDAA